MNNYFFRGGVAVIIAIPEKDAFNDDGDFVVASAKGSTAIKLPMYHGQNYNFKEESSHTSQGTLYKVSIKGSFPSAMLGDGDMRVLTTKRFCVVAIDTVGNAKIAGTKDVPLICDISHDTGNDCDTTNSISFEFYGTQYKLAADSVASNFV